MQQSFQRARRGFTLVELLVVILIMTILLTIGAAGLRGVGGKGVTSAVASTESLFEEARSLAIGKGTRARVMVYIDDPKSEYYLRRVAVAFEELDDDGTPKANSWKLAGRGYTLPDKTYFSKLYSKKDHDGRSGDLEEFALTGNGANYNGRYLYYEFNAEGICTTGLSGENYTGASFVVGAGARPPGGEPKATGEGRRNFGGFVIWRNGATSIFRDPTQVIGNDKPQEF